MTTNPAHTNSVYDGAWDQQTWTALDGTPVHETFKVAHGDHTLYVRLVPARGYCRAYAQVAVDPWPEYGYEPTHVTVYGAREEQGETPTVNWSALGAQTPAMALRYAAAIAVAADFCSCRELWD